MDRRMEGYAQATQEASDPSKSTFEVLDIFEAKAHDVQV